MTPYAEYNSDAYLPLPPGAIELVMWQTMGDAESGSPYTLDPTLHNLTSHPLAATSISHDNRTYHGYGVRCDVNSTVGHASLSPKTNTFSAFTQAAASDLTFSTLPGLLTNYPGVSAIQSLVFAAFTTLYIAYMSPPKCGGSPYTSSENCNGWIGANLATNGVPTFQPKTESPKGSGNYTGGYLQHSAISPERMTLAMQNSLSPSWLKDQETWTSDSASNATAPLFLHGIDPANSRSGYPPRRSSPVHPLDSCHYPSADVTSRFRGG